MRSLRSRHTPWTLPALAAGLIACNGEQSPTAPTKVVVAHVSVSAGLSHTCGVTPSGATYCWGDNGYGELGNGTTTSSATPVAVSGGLTFAAVSADNQTCGVTRSGAAYCWGQNRDGELGNGTETNSTTPVAVSGGLTFAVISAGVDHTCGVTSSGAAYCWGLNRNGQLGNGTETNSATPVAVSGGLTFAAP